MVGDKIERLEVDAIGIEVVRGVLRRGGLTFVVG